MSKQTKPRKMTFSQARIKLRKLANGRYHSISVEYTAFPANKNVGLGSGKICTIYLSGYKHYKEGSWEKAFAALESELK